jgi:hypothetical protein
VQSVKLERAQRVGADPQLEQEPIVFRDYSREASLIRRLHRAAMGVETAVMVLQPLLAIAKLLGRERLEKSLSAVEVVDNWAERTQWIASCLWKLRYGQDSVQRSTVVRSLCSAGEFIGALDSSGCSYRYHDVFGIPVAVEPYPGSDVFYSPASAAEILAVVTRVGTRWLLDHEAGLVPDDALVPSVQSDETTDIIERTMRHSACRAWVLWGPPRGGKSVAARQIAQAVGDGWVRVCGKAALDPHVWAAIFALKPAALILDDLDACAKEDDALLGWIEVARGFARVIISTMNILPGVARGDGSHELRGALLAPGRAADERPRLYAGLEQGIRDLIAPSVAPEFRAADLLAGYLAELEKRAQVGAVTQLDVDEMRERMKAVGDR